MPHLAARALVESRSRQRGFTILEALIAFLVLAFGLLAVAGFSISLSRNSDVAKQRTEATRLAQERMETLRSFQVIPVTGALPSYAGLTAGTDVTTTNASFNRTWTVNGTAADLMRTVTVRVAWEDRSGQQQDVILSSVISRTDPVDVGGLNLPPVENGILRRPMGRDINIPIPATTLGGSNSGRSYLPFTGSGYLVFNNSTGVVVAICTAQPTSTTDLAATCTTIQGYLLLGFITGDVTTYIPTGIAFSANVNIVGTPTCTVGQATDQNNGTPIPNMLYYACLIRPGPTAPLVWGGRADIVPAPTGTQVVCRFSPSATTTVNRQHPAVYANVNETLDNQNFHLLNMGGICPAGSVQHAP